MTKDGRPLDGIRVLDFTRVLAGPYATTLMADLGADVIKIEAPGGDDYRHVGPFRDGESALFQTVNRGKRSIVLDLRSADDLAVARNLAGRADVVVENFRPGVMEKLGLDAAALQAANPGLVYASVSGFGQCDPHAARPAYDIIVQAMSGLMDLTGEPAAAPTMVGEAMADVAVGIIDKSASNSARSTTRPRPVRSRSNSATMIPQAALHEFCERGLYDLHVSRMHRIYRRRKTPDAEPAGRTDSGA